MHKFLGLRGVPDYASLTLDQLVRTAEAGRIPERTRTVGAALASLEVKSDLTKDVEAQLLREPGADTVAMLKAIDRDRRAILERVAVAIHEWASNVYVAFRFRQAAGNIFDRFKSATDAVLASLCRDAINKLNHAIDRAASEDPEEWSDAALACRRVLKAFADSVYPARAEKVDGRSVGDAEYKNRLWAFAKARGRQELEGQFLAEEEIEGLCKALDKVYDLSSKGIHAGVTQDEAELAALRTYVLLAQLAPLVRSVGEGGDLGSVPGRQADPRGFTLAADILHSDGPALPPHRRPDAADPRVEALPSCRVGLRGEGGRLAHGGDQD